MEISALEGVGGSDVEWQISYPPPFLDLSLRDLGHFERSGHFCGSITNNKDGPTSDRFELLYPLSNETKRYIHFQVNGFLFLTG